MAGRPRKTIEQRLAEGSYRPGRHGPISASVAGRGVPVPPGDLAPGPRAYWDRLCPKLTEAGVACETDSEALALLCWWLHELSLLRAAIDQARERGVPVRSQEYVAVGIATDKVDKLAGRFGLTPSDRAKLKADPPPPPAAPVPPRKR